LRLGTKGENNTERTAKGRGKVPNNRGEASANAKLTEKKVLEMRRLFAGGMRCELIAQQMDIHRRTAWDAIKCKTWTHI